MMAAPRALVESEPSKELAQIIEADIGIGSSAEDVGENPIVPTQQPLRSQCTTGAESKDG